MMTLTMDGIQLYKNNNEHKISMPLSMTREPSLSELDNLKNAGEKFFDIKEIQQEKSGKYIVTYNIPMTAKNLLSVKQSNEILKLSILNEVLKDNIIEQKGGYIPLLHPANIFFLDMKTVRYMYVDNGMLYRSEKPALEQYKALIISILTKYSYEKMQNSVTRKEVLMKLDNLFLIQIEKSNSVEQLQELIRNRLNKIESEFFLMQYQEDKIRKRKNDTKLTVIMVCVIVVFIIMLIILLGGK